MMENYKIKKIVIDCDKIVIILMQIKKINFKSLIQCLKIKTFFKDIK